MNILQSGIEKSGNYWISRILRELMGSAGLEIRSYIQNHSIHAGLKQLDLDIEDIADIDCIDISKNRCFVVVRQSFREAIKDISEYTSLNSIVWTHSNWIDSMTPRVLDEFEKKIYIIRDPRDALLSFSHFAFTPYRLLHDSRHYQGPSDWLDNNLEPFLGRWKNHVRSHLSRRSEFNIYPIFYERFLSDLEGEISKLASYLALSITNEDKHRILDLVKASSLKKGAPHHIRKAKSGQWEAVFTLEQKARALEIVGPLLCELGYGTESPACLPSLQGDLRKEEARPRMLRSIASRIKSRLKEL